MSAYGVNGVEKITINGPVKEPFTVYSDFPQYKSGMYNCILILFWLSEKTINQKKGGGGVRIFFKNKHSVSISVNIH